VKFLAERASDFSEKDVFEKLMKMMKFLLLKNRDFGSFWRSHFESLVEILREIR
jgi:hypothetical protein